MILKNTSLFDIKFRIFLDSETDQLLANNRNGKVLFDCSPSFGTVAMNDEIKLKVCFAFPIRHNLMLKFSIKFSTFIGNMVYFIQCLLILVTAILLIFL